MADERQRDQKRPQPEQHTSFLADDAAPVTELETVQNLDHDIARKTSITSTER
jgi:hypothetical protein